MKPKLRWNCPLSLRRNHSVGCGNLIDNYNEINNLITLKYWNSWETMTETMTMTNFVTETTTTVDVSLLVSVAVVTLTEVQYLIHSSIHSIDRWYKVRLDLFKLYLENDSYIDVDGYIDHYAVLWPLGHIITNSSQCCYRLQELLQRHARGRWRRGRIGGRPRET